MRALLRLGIATALVTVLTPGAAAQIPDRLMAGTWSGDAALGVDWLTRTSIPVHLTIDADGGVTGTVGDAQLSGARFCPNRDRVQEALGMGREHLVTGQLHGPIIRAEAQQRALVYISVDWRDGAFVGELETSGGYDGPPHQRRIMGTRLVLRRVAPDRASRSERQPNPQR